jgi:hypothetical protein
LFDEAVPVPTIKVSGRLLVTYAGFTNESTLLETLYKRGLQGEEIAPELYAQPGLLMYRTHSINRSPDVLQWAQAQKRDARPTALYPAHDGLTLSELMRSTLSTSHAISDPNAAKVTEGIKEQEIMMADCARRYLLAMQETEQYKRLRRVISAAIYAISNDDEADIALH